MDESRIQQALLFHFLSSLDENFSVASSLETADFLKSKKLSPLTDHDMIQALYTVFMKKKKSREKIIYHGDVNKLQIREFKWNLNIPIAEWLYFLKQARDLEIFLLLTCDFLKLKGVDEALGFKKSKINYHRQSALITFGSLMSAPK